MVTPVDEIVNGPSNPQTLSLDECEELACRLLASLPRSRLAVIQRKLVPLLHFDVVGSLPAEIALQIFSLLSPQSLLACGLVSRRWQTLANDQSLWMKLCCERGWRWRQPSRAPASSLPLASHSNGDVYDDEGMGDSDSENDGGRVIHDVEAAKAELTLMHAELDSGFGSMLLDDAPALDPSPSDPGSSIHPLNVGNQRTLRRPITRHSAPASLKTFGPKAHSRPDYKLLYQTHLKTRGTQPNAHTSTIYCVQLYTYPSGCQVLFTGSRDRTVREWNLNTGLVQRVVSGVHVGSILSLCAYNGHLASAGSDRRVVLWDLERNQPFKVLNDHTDSVLCVRFDDERLVSCSKDNLVKTYSWPSMAPEFVLRGHRAAVNAIALSKTHIVSGSGDRSIKLWDAKTGNLLRTFDNHHSRGIASIDFQPPYILTGSSDKHLRLIDMTTSQGWSTSPEYHYPDATSDTIPSLLLSSAPSNNARLMCQVCGSENVHVVPPGVHGPCVHSDLVRSVALGQDFVMSGSYDLSIKVWDRRNGAMIADLKGGHTARIFCITFDHTKIVSCGEDQRICIWDFSHGIDTSFLHHS